MYFNNHLIYSKAISEGNFLEGEVLLFIGAQDDRLHPSPPYLYTALTLWSE